MSRYLLLGLALAACGPVEEADPTLHAGDRCDFAHRAVFCSGQGQTAVTCPDTGYGYVTLPQRCQNPCRSPGDYCDIGLQPVGAQCAGDVRACRDASTRVGCGTDGVMGHPLDCSALGGCDTVNGVSDCRGLR